MPKLLIYLLVMLFIMPATAFAEVKINISNNLEGSTNNVKINSNTSEKTQSNEGGQNQTDIVINNNGEVKEYHGNGEGNIEVKSSDGKSSVNVNNNSATNAMTQSSTSNVTTSTNITVNSNTSDSSASATPEAMVAGQSLRSDDLNSETQESMGFWNYIKKQFDGFLELFS